MQEMSAFAITADIISATKVRLSPDYPSTDKT